VQVVLLYDSKFVIFCQIDFAKFRVYSKISKYEKIFMCQSRQGENGVSDAQRLSLSAMFEDSEGKKR